MLITLYIFFKLEVPHEDYWHSDLVLVNSKWKSRIYFFHRLGRSCIVCQTWTLFVALFVVHDDAVSWKTRAHAHSKISHRRKSIALGVYSQPCSTTDRVTSCKYCDFCYDIVQYLLLSTYFYIL